MAFIAMTGQDESSGTALLAATGQAESSQKASIAVKGQDEASIAMAGQEGSSSLSTTDASGGSAADATTSGGSTAVSLENRESSVTVSTTATRQAESTLLDATTIQGAEVSTTLEKLLDPFVAKYSVTEPTRRTDPCAVAQW